MKLVKNSIIEIYVGKESDFVIERSQKGEVVPYPTLQDFIDHLHALSLFVPDESDSHPQDR